MEPVRKNRRFDSTDALALILSAGLALAMGVRAHQIRAAEDITGDEGTYLCTAKALAEGRGYRHPNLPGEPAQTKYPPLFPIVLAGIWWLNPRFPENVFLVQLMHALLSGCLFWAAYRLLRYDWKMEPPLAVAGVCAALFHPLWWSLAQQALSEVMYTLLAVGAIVVLASAARATGERDRQGAPAPRAWRMAVQAGLLAATACLTRVAGAAAVGAVALVFLKQRRWRELLVAVGAAAAPVALWLIWRAAAVAANRNTPHAAAFSYDLEYAAWLPDNPGSWIWVAYLNFGRLLAAIGAWISLVPTEQYASLLLTSPAARVVAWSFFALCFALIVIGLARVARRGAIAAPTYVLMYWVLVLLWPTDPETPFRLQMPLVPLLVPALLLGIEGVCLTIGGLFQTQARPESGPQTTSDSRTAPSRSRRIVEFAQKAAMGTAGVLIAWNLINGLSNLRGYAQRAAAAVRSELATYFREQCPRDAVVAAPSPGDVYLRTGRKAVFPGPGDVIVPFSYPEDARFLAAGLGKSQSTYRNYREAMERELVAYYRRAGVTHLALGGFGGRSVVQEIVSEQTDRFRLTTRIGPYEIFEVLPAPEASD